MSVQITYFVHGTTTDNEKNISSGWKDVELSDLGVRQSGELLDKIKEKTTLLGEMSKDENKFDSIFCSDLKRAVDSAHITWGESGIPIVQDERLRECNYGDYNGASSDVVEPMQEINIDKQFPNGESYNDVKDRIESFLKFIKENYADKHIAIVAHKAPQLCLDVILKGMTFEQAFANDWRKVKAWRAGWEYEV